MTKLDKDHLFRLIGAQPGLGSTEICARLGGINRSTLTRGLKSLGQSVVSVGNTRRTRYALRRPLRGSTASLPLFMIDAEGRGHDIGELILLHPNGAALRYGAEFLWPLDRAMADGWFDGLPYPLYDMRPQGFLGRHFAHRYALDLGVPDNPDHWSDDDIAHVLNTTGYDLPGNLILGEVAYRRFLDLRQMARPAITNDQMEECYPRLAAEAMLQGVAGSSAAGEFPKFTASRVVDGVTFSVIVKFSGADASPAVRRWSDLLVCEQVASTVLAEQLNIDAVRSSIYRFAGRTFLEVVRFDRVGEIGRLPVCTLATVGAALAGGTTSGWQKLTQKLAEGQWLTMADAERVALLGWFGKLIANTDMHEGNLAFLPGLKLAPVYDMLPMMYAPLRGGEIPGRVFFPEQPLPRESSLWLQAATVAINYWSQCADDSRISDEFRRVCAENRRIVQGMV